MSQNENFLFSFKVSLFTVQYMYDGIYYKVVAEYHEKKFLQTSK